MRLYNQSGTTGNYALVSLNNTDGRSSIELPGCRGLDRQWVSVHRGERVALRRGIRRLPDRQHLAADVVVGRRDLQGSWTTTSFIASTGWSCITLGDPGTSSSTHNMAGSWYYDEVVISNSYVPPYDVTRPAPPTVRDGLYADVTMTSSTTQLSANWDAVTDAESGISGYQYAIGTTAGATDTVNWTNLANVTTVTKTGLSLLAGQTYFFSVRAINTVALTGSATNSNGQVAGRWT